MPTPFGLQASGQILAAGTNVKIFVSTPKDPNTEELLYRDRVRQLVDLLTGNSGPYMGASVEIRGYMKPTAEQFKDTRYMEVLERRTRGNVLVQYDNNQVDDPPKPNQRAIWRVMLEDQIFEDEWDATDSQKSVCALPPGNQKRDGSPGCSNPPETLSSTRTSQTGPITSGPTTPRSSRPSAFTTFAYNCYPFQDPDAGLSGSLCECDGLDGKFPALSQSSGATSFNPCGYTTTPTIGPESPKPFTTTKPDGEVIVCATSTYYNYAVNRDPVCAGSTTVISTAASINSVYSASVAASKSAAYVISTSAANEVSTVAAHHSSASAVWSSARAVPSAGCWILSDDGDGDSTFQVYGIKDWAGDGGASLHKQIKGCGILTGWTWQTGELYYFSGKRVYTQSADFGLSFFKGGCVERAVHSAGGPPPGKGSDQLECRHYTGNDAALLSISKDIKAAQLKTGSAAASNGSTSKTEGSSQEDK